MALAITLIAGYEFVSLVSPLPTISRIVQGWRDDGYGTAVLALTVAVVAAIGYFAVWLFQHFRKDERSNL